MKSLKKHFKSVFGHNRSERRSSIILLVLLFAVISVRVFFTVSTVTVGGYPIIGADSVVTAPNSDPKQQNYTGKSIYPLTPQNNLVKKSIELNSCDSAALESLPGLGPVLSARIVKFRALLGGFYSVEQLKEVYGLDVETFEKVSGLLYVDTTLVSKITVNVADYRQLIRLPYLTRDDVNAILRYRTVSGGAVGSMDELVSDGVISEETSRKVYHYLDFR